MKEIIVDKYSEEELRKIVSESFSMSEVCYKLGYKTRTGRNNDTIQKRLDYYHISTEHFRIKKPIKRNEDNVFINPSNCTQAVLRRWYERGKYSEYKCAICGLEPIWNNKELILTLDHIDGNKYNNELSNLRWICPNCDRQLITNGFKGQCYNVETKEKNNKPRKIPGTDGKFKTKTKPKTKEERKQIAIDRLYTLYGINRDILKEKIYNNSFLQIGREYGVNGNSVKKWCKTFNLPSKREDIKKYSIEEWENI